MRRRILLLVVGMTVLVVLAFAIPLAVLIRTQVVQDARTHTLDQASHVALFLRGYPAPSTARIRRYVAAQSADSGRPVSVTLPDGEVIGSTPATSSGYRSRSNGSFGGRPPGTDPGGGGPRFGGPQAQLLDVPGGQLAASVVPSPDGEYVVDVYLSDDAAHSGEGERWALLAGLALVLIALGVVGGELLTRRIVRPLVQTAATAQQLSAGDTAARAPTSGPAEVGAVGVALNRLADRIDQLIAEERETVADLSHRLRTPLTALRLDAEALHDAEEAQRVGAHVSALERMLTAVIHAARRPQREGRMPACDARGVVEDRVAFWSALTEDQRRAADVQLPPDALPVRASAEDLATAVDALLENVVAHTPEGTPFAVRLTASGAGARLVVSDDGPGLPPEEPVRGRSDRGSSGLGLDIARRCAQASGGSMILATAPSGGASITLELGPP